MANRYDIVLSDNEPVAQNGDFLVGPSDEQHIQDTINAYPGWWKEFPRDGVGIADWIGSGTDTQEATKKIRVQLTADGYTVNNPVVKLGADGKLEVKPNATI